MSVRFVSEAIVAQAGAFDPRAMSAGEPALPPSFTWRNRTLAVVCVRSTKRSYKDDRGDTYLKRHYFEVELADGAVAVIYFERGARRGAARWFLYTIDDQPA